MAGFTNDANLKEIVFCDNVDFSGSATPSATMQLDGQLFIGSSVDPRIAPATLTASTGVLITNGHNSIAIGIQPAVPNHFTANSGTATPAANNLNVLGGTGISTSGSGSTLTINATGGGLTWNFVSTNQAMSVNNGYIAGSPGGALTFSLPAVSAVGQMLALTLDGATSWQITQGAGQSIKIGSSVTTTGAGGSLTSEAQGDTILLVCSVANLRWNAISIIGNLMVV